LIIDIHTQRCETFSYFAVICWYRTVLHVYFGIYYRIIHYRCHYSNIHNYESRVVAQLFATTLDIRFISIYLVYRLVNLANIMFHK